MEPIDALKAAGIPEDKARVFMDSLHRDLDNRYRIPVERLVTRGEFAEAVSGVKVSIAEVRTEVAEVRTEIAAVRTEIADTKAELIKWFLASMMAMTAVIIAASRFTST
ncbi:MAG: hypothetical protein JO133_06295 [Burkholderiaceae bacterium]|nr:hypothetical protein [Burkholderiaceae bacterium]